MKTKTCTQCLTLKPANTDYFSSQKRGKYGINSRCKDCERAYQRSRRAIPEIKERHRLKMIKYRADNPEKTLEVSRKNYRINGKKNNEKRKHLYHTSTEHRAMKEYSDKKYRASEKGQAMLHSPKNTQAQRDRNEKYRKNNKEEIKAYTAKYRDENRDFIRSLDIKRRAEISNSYIASSMRMSVKDLHPETIETKRLIIKLKREINKLWKQKEN